MPKMTKTQVKRMLLDIQKKAQKLWAADMGANRGGWMVMSTPDMVAIDKICKKNLKKLG